MPLPKLLVKYSNTKRGFGDFSAIFACRSSTTLASATHSSISTEALRTGAFFLSMSIVNTKSAAVQGVPSLHFTPSLRWIVTSVKSSLYSWPVAIQV